MNFTPGQTVAVSPDADVFKDCYTNYRLSPESKLNTYVPGTITDIHDDTLTVTLTTTPVFKTDERNYGYKRITEIVVLKDNISELPTIIYSIYKSMFIKPDGYHGYKLIATEMSASIQLHNPIDPKNYFSTGEFYPHEIISKIVEYMNNPDNKDIMDGLMRTYNKFGVPPPPIPAANAHEPEPVIPPPPVKKTYREWASRKLSEFRELFGERKPTKSGGRRGTRKPKGASKRRRSARRRRAFRR